MFECDICNELFSTCKRRKRHRKQTHAHLQCVCRRTFVLEKEREQHRLAMIANAKTYKCPVCCLSFNTEDGRNHHMQRFKHGCHTVPVSIECTQQQKLKEKRTRQKKICTGDHVCNSCSARFVTQGSLLQHQQSRGHMQNNDSRKTYFDNYYEREVKVDVGDMAASRRLVDSTMNSLMSHVRDLPGGTIFSPNVIKAGSVPVNTKIGKADEFDTNIELDVTTTAIRTHGKLNYGFVGNGNTANMKEKLDIERRLETISIPSGFATVRVEKGSVPSTLVYDNDIVPRAVKQDLFNKIETARNELSLMNIDVSKISHGPAVTMTIHPKETGIKHDINVDITPSLKSNVSLTEYGWPRPETRRAFSKNLIDRVIETGTHLVPKKDEFWSISNSKAERTLMSGIDAGNGCRKKVYKMMKKFVQTCKSQSADGLPEISSHILKTQVLWSSEKHSSDDYWHERNRDICLTDTLKDMETALQKGQLPDFFNPDLNVLEGKRHNQLRTLADHFGTVRKSFESK